MFDLGGVLADLGDPVTSLGLEMSNKDFWDIWLNSSSVHAFETGSLSADEFCPRLGRELGLGDGGFSEERLNSWQLSLYPGAEELVRALAINHDLVLLSNTNPNHWEQQEKSTQVFSLFSHVFLSYETGLYKPSREPFRHAIELIGRNPADIIYVDDTAQNVMTASQLGINAHRAKGIESVEEVLIGELGL